MLLANTFVLPAIEYTPVWLYLLLGAFFILAFGGIVFFGAMILDREWKTRAGASLLIVGLIGLTGSIVTGTAMETASDENADERRTAVIDELDQYGITVDADVAGDILRMKHGVFGTVTVERGSEIIDVRIKQAANSDSAALVQVIDDRLVPLTPVGQR